ncbi:MAG: TetR/AcrR family transcriptional regulator [Deltaproteobacteria bacterium]|nr:TetR/AcrR family transcriptional regulator [Deltaproteobacteria bacterium]
MSDTPMKGTTKERITGKTDMKNWHLPHKGNTKQVILDLAEDLLVKRGFKGFSYKNISTLLGIKNAAIHYHYPTKSDLGVEIIRRERVRFEEFVAGLELEQMNAAQKMETFLDKYRNLPDSKDRITLASALEMNFKVLPDEMQEETRKLIFAYIDWLEDILKAGLEDAAFKFSGSPRDQASLILSILHGAMSLAQATDDSFLDAATRQIMLTLGK